MNTDQNPGVDLIRDHPRHRRFALSDKGWFALSDKGLGRSLNTTQSNYP